MRRRRRWALVAVGAIVVPLILGGGFELVASAADDAAYPAPGVLVDIGNARLHIRCVGAGSPAVILEAASDGISSSWAWVQPEVSKTTRTCAYDRAGRAWSSVSPRPRHAERIADELRALLRAARISPPYVLVGHSAGGLFVRAFAARHPQDVAGLVLVDSSHPEDPAVVATLDDVTRSLADTAFLGRLGITRLLHVLGLRDAGRGLPDRARAEIVAFGSRPSHQDSVITELDARLETDAQVRAAPPLGRIGLAVVTAGVSTPDWLDLQRRLATLSPVARHVVVDGATHYSLLYDRAHASVTSSIIADVVVRAR